MPANVVAGASHAAKGYVGRFAPSPTGPLHFGSFVAAVASYLDARAHAGRWLLRFEDLDRPRCVPGADSLILRALEAHGLRWDGAPVYQSRRLPRYEAALARLADLGVTFYCRCSRRQLRGYDVYPGFCRAMRTPSGAAEATRLRVPDGTEIAFDDAIQGRYVQRVDRAVGDFVIKRRDGIIAYQLAVVVDDAEQAVTHVVRGADLLDNTPRQCLLTRRLGYPPLRYAHVPVIVDRRAVKLSKQTQARAVGERFAAQNLSMALQLLGQPLPTACAAAPVPVLLDWAIAHWQRRGIPRIPAFQRFLGL